MVRNAVRVLVVVGLLGIGWVAGHAQAPTQVPPAAPSVSSDFELVVALGDYGQTVLTCVRGCRLTWAPVGEDMLAPDVRVRGSMNTDGCLAMHPKANNCRVLGWRR